MGEGAPLIGGFDEVDAAEDVVEDVGLGVLGAEDARAQVVVELFEAGSDAGEVGGQALGLIWFDAHGDMNTPETSHSGNVHGMPLAAILGQGPEELLELGLRRPLVNPEQVALVGIRDLDREEARAVRASGVRHFTMRDIDARGIHAVMEEALAVVTSGTAGFHLSFDVDGVDPAVTPGVGTPVPGGTDWRESHLVMELAAESGSLLGLEVVEVNPILDTRNTTAEVAVDLILSALGKTII